MTKTLFVQIEYVTLHEAQPSDFGAKLTVNGVTIRDKYMREFGTGDSGGPSSADWFDYSEFRIAGASFDRIPFEYGYYTDDDGTNWSYGKVTTVTVPDNFVIPPDIARSNTGDFSVSGGQVSLPDIEIDLTPTISGGITIFPAFQEAVGTLKSGAVSAFYTALGNVGRVLGIADLAGDVKNALGVKTALESILNNAFGTLEYGLSGINDPNFDPAQYDARVEQLFKNTDAALSQAIKDVTLYRDNPELETRVDALLGASQILLQVARGDRPSSIPLAEVGVEINVGGLVSVNIVGSWDADIIWDGDRSSVIDGGGGSDILYGGIGDDYLYGGGGQDYLSGGAGDDVLIPGGRSAAYVDTGLGGPPPFGKYKNFLRGGDGTDTADFGAAHTQQFLASAPISADLATGSAIGPDGGSQFAATLVDIENLAGTSWGDTLGGDVKANQIHGRAGDDLILSGAGPDYLRGDEGADVIGGGDDFDNINGNMGADLVHGDGGGDWVVGGKDNDRLFGDDGDDIVSGNLGDDVGEGGSGADFVRGGQSADVLTGGDGSDWLSGDRGDDTLTGGTGADTFRSFAEAGLDWVVDFSAGEGDRVQLDPGTPYTLAQSGADTLIIMGGDNRMVLVGVTLSSLPPGWIFEA